MKKHSIASSIAIAALIVLAPSFAQAQPADAHEHCMMPSHHGMSDDKFMDGPVPPFVHGLNLTEAQRDAIFNIMHDQAPLMRDKMKALHKSQEALQMLTMSNQYDDTKAKTLAEDAAEDMAALSLLRAQSEHKIYALLTPEQRKQANEIKAMFDFHPAMGHEGKSQAGLRAI